MRSHATRTAAWTLVALAFAAPTSHGQQRPAARSAVATLSIRVTGEKAANAQSGMITFPRQGQQARVSVVAVDAAGKPVSLAGLAPRWSSSDKAVASTYGNPVDNPIGVAILVIAQEPGRAVISVTAAGKTASIPVVVGDARTSIAASELTPAFRVARLEIVAEKGYAGPEAEGSANGIRLRENGHGVLLRARAFAADGSAIPVVDFPVVWTTADSTVVNLFQTGEAQTQTTARAPGATTITATIQGITATVNATVVAMGTQVGPIGAPIVVATAAGGGAPASGNVPAAAPTTGPTSAPPTTPGVVTSPTPAPSGPTSSGSSNPIPSAGAQGRAATDPIALGTISAPRTGSASSWFDAPADMERWVSFTVVGVTCASAGQTRQFNASLAMIPAGSNYDLSIGPAPAATFLGGAQTVSSTNSGNQAETVAYPVPCGQITTLLVRVQRTSGPPTAQPYRMTFSY